MIKGFLWPSLGLIFLVSCKKNDQNNPVETLQSHLWHQYKTRIVGADTMTVTIWDTVTTSTSSIINVDTTITLDGCINNSTFSFRRDGILSVQSQCNQIPTPYDTTWSLLQNSLLSAVFISDPTVKKYYYNRYPFPFGLGTLDTTFTINPIRGTLTAINRYEFTFNNAGTHIEFDRGTQPRPGVMIDTSRKSTINEYTTFRSE